MALPIKTTVTQIIKTDDVIPSIANQPHLDLETTLDSILSYFQTSFIGYFENDSATTTGLTFGYEAGVVKYNNTHVSVVSGTVLLTASQTNYVEIDNTGSVTTNTTGFTIDRIPLWILVTDVTSITTFTDTRTILSIIDTYGSAVIFNDKLTIKGSNSIVGNSTGDLKINALTGTVYIANNSGNGQLIIQDGAAGTTNQVILNGTTGSITVSGNTVWHAGNDGTGSGLDADLLNTIEATQFLRTDLDGTSTGSLTISRPAGNDLVLFTDTTNTNDLAFRYNINGNFEFTPVVSGTYRWSSSLIYDITALEWQIGTNTIWHVGNDGTGSGLDADLLDGSSVVGIEKVKVSSADTVAEYLQDAVTVSGNITESVPGDNSYLSLEYSGLNFITPVTITSSGATTAWSSFNATAFVSTTSTHVILECSGGVNGSGTSYVKIRKDSGSDSYILHMAYSSVRIGSSARQGIFPMDSATKTFEWTVTSPGYNDGLYIKLIGYL